MSEPRTLTPIRKVPVKRRRTEQTAVVDLLDELGYADTHPLPNWAATDVVFVPKAVNIPAKGFYIGIIVGLMYTCTSSKSDDGPNDEEDGWQYSILVQDDDCEWIEHGWWPGGRLVSYNEENFEQLRTEGRLA